MSNKAELLPNVTSCNLGDRVTDMQLLYAKVRIEERCGHRATLRAMFRLTGIDPDSIDRALQRARRTDAIEAKRAKKAAA